MRQRLYDLLMTDVECNKDGHGECSMCPYQYADHECQVHINNIITDFLISKGVVALPVKPGDTVYTIHRGKIKEWTVYYIGMNSLGKFTFNITDKDLQNSREILENWIGGLVFLTEEDAINELKERKSYDNA